MKVYHTLEPIYDNNSTLTSVYKEYIGNTIEERKNFLLRHHIALFDVLKSCDISSSSDSSIKNPVPNDLSLILLNSNIKAIFTTGKKAHQLYKKYCYPITLIEDICLPSTSPANCPKGIEDNINLYEALLRLVME